MGIFDSFKEFVGFQDSTEKSNNDLLKDCGSTEKIEDSDRKENISGSSDKVSFQMITPKSISEKLLRRQSHNCHMCRILEKILVNIFGLYLLTFQKICI